MNEGDFLKYMPTSTVGKATEVRVRDGKEWVRLDRTGLYYDSALLAPASESEYKEVSFKELERKPAVLARASDPTDGLHSMEEDVDIREFTPSGGG